MTEAEVSALSEPQTPPAMIDTAGGQIPRARATRSLMHGGITTSQFLAIHLMGAGFPLVAGIVLYGWRAMLSVAIVIASTAAAIAVWRRIGQRGNQLSYSHGLWLALLLSLTLPAHLAANTAAVSGQAILCWPMLPA